LNASLSVNGACSAAHKQKVRSKRFKAIAAMNIVRRCFLPELRMKYFMLRTPLGVLPIPCSSGCWYRCQSCTEKRTARRSRERGQAPDVTVTATCSRAGCEAQTGRPRPHHANSPRRDMGPLPIVRLGSEKNKLSNVQKSAASTLRPTQVPVSRSTPCKRPLLSIAMVLLMVLTTGLV
jgi:hypothetical protein